MMLVSHYNAPNFLEDLVLSINYILKGICQQERSMKIWILNSYTPVLEQPQPL